MDWTKRVLSQSPLAPSLSLFLSLSRTFTFRSVPFLIFSAKTAPPLSLFHLAEPFTLTHSFSLSLSLSLSLRRSLSPVAFSPNVSSSSTTLFAAFVQSSSPYSPKVGFSSLSFSPKTWKECSNKWSLFQECSAVIVKPAELMTIFSVRWLSPVPWRRPTSNYEIRRQHIKPP